MEDLAEVRVSGHTCGFTVGVDLGQRQDHTAIAVVEAQLRPRVAERQFEEHSVVRHLEKASLGTDYVIVARRLKAMATSLTELAEAAGRRRRLHGLSGNGASRISEPTFYVDVTGLGGPFCDFLHEENRGMKIVAVSITRGDQDHIWEGSGYRVLHVGKEALIGRLQLLLGTGRIHLPESAAVDQLVEELRLYQARVSAGTGHISYGAQVGRHDDLVIATALAVWERRRMQPVRRPVQYA